MLYQSVGARVAPVLRFHCASERWGISHIGPIAAVDARTSAMGPGFPLLDFLREGGRADEGGGLENRQRGDPLVGSNPTPPAEARPSTQRRMCLPGTGHP